MEAVPRNTPPQQDGAPPPSRQNLDSLEPNDNGDAAPEAMGLLRPNEAVQREKESFLPDWLRKKRYFALLIVTILVVGTILAVFGGLGKLGDLGKKEKHDLNAPKDGLSPPWYPTPKGGTVSGWAESYRKAQKMVERMSFIEKVNVTTGVGWQMGLCVGNTGPATSVGFPSLCLQDGPLGLRFADNITAFPAGITIGATWDRDLMRKRGQLLGLEARLKGVNVLLGPALGPLGTLPAGGRNWEGFGSDPVLQGVAAAETIRGIQENGVIATAKHYVLNEQEHYRQPLEWGITNAMSSNIDDRTLREVYIWPFAESVRAGVASIMCAYQMVNSSYSCGNSLLLNGILKDELGFQGFVQSDWWAQHAGVSTALAGLDMSMPGGGPRDSPGASYWGSNLSIAALNTSVPMERLNDMATRIVAAWYQLKQDSWPKPPPDGDGGPNFSSWTREKIGRLHQGSDDKDATGVVNRYVKAQGEGEDAHKLVARRIAAESTVLLKNEDLMLPLSRNGGASQDNATYRVGIYGEDAGPGKGPNFCPDRACNQGTLGSGWGSGAVEFPYLITPGKALTREFNNESVAVSLYLQNEIVDRDLEAKDLCIAFANADAGEGFASDGDIHGDRNDLFLQKDGDRLIEHVASKCGNGTGNTVVVIHSVGPVILESWIDLPGVKAVVLANVPGQESGDALASFLFGDVDACGRLPYTIGKSLDDYGPEAKVLYKTDQPVPEKDFSHGLYIDYRYFDKHNITPRYEFGYGLSYTNFSFSNLIVTPLQNKSALPSARPQPQILPPLYSNEVPSPKDALFPKGFRRLSKYIYPYISSVKQVKRGKYEYPEGYNITQQPSPAGGGEGGNPSLFEPFVNVSVAVTNTGMRAGKEVIQLYVSFPGNVTDVDISAEEYRSNSTGNRTAPVDLIDFPVRMLRNFQKIELLPGKSATVNMSLTRKDLSYWSTRRQNWVMPMVGKLKIWVGRSSRDLPLVGEF
ncbi:glycoside hydrolase family 3 protein [Emydomyces testavorans]|uniref:Probable beta-glucosidase E n=1 Tax=Emydomyces testavorans TaxID=2070801 RepID=A0AAF0DNG3_9EURO|nr:glycoside hydrolase family 3 protein [Emydomyces testavorans]